MSKRTRENRRRHRNISKKLIMEGLEDRQLLAADLGIGELATLDTTTNQQQPRGDGERGQRVSAAPIRAAAPRQIDTSEGPVNGPVGDVDFEVPAIDGTGNNESNPNWGAAHSGLLRLTTLEYEDGVEAPSGDDRPSAREVSNAVAAQTELTENSRGLTDMTWLWGQFIDHDIGITEGADPAEAFDIEVPLGDEYFDPFFTGQQTISLSRSDYVEGSGHTLEDPRTQINEITAFLDGSVIYGSDEERAAELRTFENGLLKTSDGEMLPFNEAGLSNAGGTSDTLFLAGDIRANENAALSSMHTIWVREHNRIAAELSQQDPGLTDEQVYQQARRLVTAQLQAITYNEFLPALLGQNAISEYQGYDAEVNPGIANVFSTAIYRFGHSMLSTELLRLNNDGTTADEGNLSLSDAFFATDELTEHGIDSLLVGAANQVAQEVDNEVVDDIRNFLFGPPGAGGFDLASLNIQRGRDHGLADYNQVREDMGLQRAETFADITSDVELQAKLEALYGDVDSVDVWVGNLAEDHVRGASVGELGQTVMADQFERIRDGDRFWYQNTFQGRQLQQIENTTLADVIERNSDVTGLQENVFFIDGEPGNPPPPGDGPNDGPNNGPGDGPGNGPGDGPGGDRQQQPPNNGPGNGGPDNGGPDNGGPNNDGPPPNGPRPQAALAEAAQQVVTNNDVAVALTSVDQDAGNQDADDEDESTQRRRAEQITAIDQLFAQRGRRTR